MIGTKLGPYEITAKLGEGGMGEVYRATDTKLKRDVAIKVLPQGFTEDKERLARFEREAQLLAQLQHPNIASIYGMEESERTRALVMELVEGPTLAERLEQGPLLFNESLSVSLQIAQALEEAHEKGIIHRDLKPQNIKASREGKVKVLDFGLAKAMDPTSSASGGSSASQLAASPTLTLGATQMGVILGTAAYMSPEQAKGMAVDKRADIWAFGVVFWEMLTGQRLFEGETVTETLAAVLRAEIDFGALPPATPPEVATLVRRCLERNPKDRLRDIGEARLLLAGPRGASAAGPGGSTREVADEGGARSPLRGAAVAAASLLVGVALALGWSALRGTAPSQGAPRVVRFTIAPPEGTTWQRLGVGALVSPDGRSLLLQLERAGVGQLWLRPIDVLSARPLAGTEGASEPFWSPDGRAIGFRTDDSLVTLDLATGRTAIVCRCPGDDTEWSSDGRIRFHAKRRLYEVAAAGGEPVRLPIEREAFNPALLPGGALLLETGDPAGNRLEVSTAASDGSDVRALFSEAGRRTSRVQFAASGHLLYVRDHSVVARPFDPVRRVLTGDPIELATGSGVWSAGRALLSTSTHGVLVYGNIREIAPSRLVWFDRGGRELGDLGSPGPFLALDLSPDDRQVVVERVDAAGEDALWLVDAERGTSVRLTPELAAWKGTWAPDGRRIAYSTSSPPTIAVRTIDSSGPGSLIAASRPAFPSDWTNGGRIVFGWTGDVATIAPDADAQPESFLDSAAAEGQARVSPDGMVAAYVSNESGAAELYLTSFPQPGERIRVSTGGAAGPRWRADGSELYFLAADGSLMAARFSQRAGRFEVGAPERLFASPPLAGRPDGRFDADRDGRRFLLAVATASGSTAPVTVVLDWTAELTPER